MLSLRAPPPHPKGSERERRRQRGHRDTVLLPGLQDYVVGGGGQHGSSGNNPTAAAAQSAATAAAVVAAEEEATFSLVSTQIMHSRGPGVQLSGAAVFISDTVVSNHTGPWMVCAPAYRGEPLNGEAQGHVLLQGMALVFNTPQVSCCGWCCSGPNTDRYGCIY